MKRFVPCSSEEVARSLSGALWAISRPPQTRLNERTSLLFDWQLDVDGRCWLIVITDYVIRVHAETVLDGIADILAGAGIAQEDIDALAALVIAKRGQTMTPWEYFPQVFKDASKLEHEINWPERA